MKCHSLNKKSEKAVNSQELTWGFDKKKKKTKRQYLPEGQEKTEIGIILWMLMDVHVCFLRVYDIIPVSNDFN